MILSMKPFKRLVNGADGKGLICGSVVAPRYASDTINAASCVVLHARSLIRHNSDSVE